MPVGRWGVTAAPRMVRQDEASAVIVDGGRMKRRPSLSTAPAPVPPATTLDSIKAWYAQRETMRTALTAEREATVARLDEIDAMLKELG